MTEPYSPSPLPDFESNRQADGGPTFDITELSLNELRWALWAAAGTMTNSGMNIKAVHPKTEISLSAMKLLVKVLINDEYVPEFCSFLDAQYKCDHIMNAHEKEYPDSDEEDEEILNKFESDE